MNQTVIVNKNMSPEIAETMDINLLRRRFWKETGGNDLLEGKSSFQALYDSIPNRQAALKLSDTVLRCMDEGTAGGWRIAGSGVLLSEDDLRAVMSTHLVSAVSSHEHCGAAKILAQKSAGGDIKTNPDKIGEARVRAIAKEFGVPFAAVIKKEKMSRPEDLHIARAAYYCFVPFEPHKIGLPVGFVHSRNLYDNPEYGRRELQIALDIAFGPHGFDGLFSTDTAFYLVGVVSSGQNDKKAMLKAEMYDVRKENQNRPIEVQILEV